MLKLRTILLYDWLYYLTTVIIIATTFLYTQFCHFYSQYQGTEKEIYAHITDIKIDGSKITLRLMAKESLIATYYAKSKKELLYIRKNYHLGDNIKLTGNLTTIKDRRVFNLFNYRRYLYYHKIFFVLETDTICKIESSNYFFLNLKQIIINRITQLKYSSEAVKAFALGDSYLIASEVMATYQNNGINHLLALSGANVALLAIIILFCLKHLKIPRLPRYFIVTIILFFYCFMANFAASIVRATLFFALLTINKLYYFEIKTINILLLTLSLLLLYNPYYLFDLGFQFSFITSLFILLFQEYVTISQNKLINLWRVSLISFLGSLPLVIFNFYQINLLSIIYNLFFVPFVSIIIYPLSLITIAIPLFDYPLFLCVKLMEHISIICNQISFSKIILAKPPFFLIVIYYLIIILTIKKWIIKKYPAFIFLLIMLLLHANIASINRYPTLTMIDIGQGDSLLIQMPHNKANILIDTGGKMPFDKKKYQLKNHNYSTTINTIIPYLKSIGINRLNYLILTHGDYDHMGEAANLITNFKVDNIILNSYNLTEIEQDIVDSNPQKVHFFKADNSLKLYHLTLYFLNPDHNQNENDNSLVIYFSIYGYKVLLMADVSQVVEKELITKYNISNITILKIGHHGSNTSSSQEFLNITNPKYALISVGEENQFNHPHPSTLSRLKTKNIKTFLTSQSGTVIITFKPTKLIFKTCK